MKNDLLKHIEECGVVYSILPAAYLKNEYEIVTVPMNIFGTDIKFHIKTCLNDFDFDKAILDVLETFFIDTYKNYVFDLGRYKNWLLEHADKLGIDHILHYTDLYEAVYDARSKSPCLTGVVNIKSWLKKAKTIKQIVFDCLGEAEVSKFTHRIIDKVYKYIHDPEYNSQLQKTLLLKRSLGKLANTEKKDKSTSSTFDALFDIDLGSMPLKINTNSNISISKISSTSLLRNGREAFFVLEGNGEELRVKYKYVDHVADRILRVRDRVMMRYFITHENGELIFNHEFFDQTKNLFGSELEWFCVQAYTDVEEDNYNKKVGESLLECAISEISRRIIGDEELDLFYKEIERQAYIFANYGHYTDQEKADLLLLRYKFSK